MPTKPMRALVEIAARDCDGMHYRNSSFLMTEDELNSSFGDIEFYARIIGYVVSSCTQRGRLDVRQDENNLPILEWSEDTEEGFHSESIHFELIGE